MLPLLTSAQKRSLDTLTIGDNCKLGYQLMEKAAQSLAATAASMAGAPATAAITIVCGKGNNGGDGYLGGAILKELGYRVQCLALNPRAMLQGEAAQAFDHWVQCGGRVIEITADKALDSLTNQTLLVDAILGSGSQGAPRAEAAKAIVAMNESGVPILAVDSPSGLDNDTGCIASPCIRATCTLAMGCATPGLFFHPGAHIAGRVEIADLEYPPQLVARLEKGVFLADRQSVAAMLPPRKPSGSKFDHGLAAIISGSSGMSGSCALAAMAALRSGCGMVHACVPRDLVAILSAKVTEPVIHGMEQNENGTLSPAARAELIEVAERMQALVIGPGLSHDPRTATLVRELVAQITEPVILDADGLNAYKGVTHRLKRHGKVLILTPHQGEWERLFGPLPVDPIEKLTRIQAIANEYNVFIISKGNPTCVAQPQVGTFVCPFGTSALATAGSGDVLSGILVSLIAQGCSPQDATLLGPLLHGLAGASAAALKTEYGTIASDLVEAIPAAIAALGAH